MATLTNSIVLPGPDTKTKQDAVAYAQEDPRMGAMLDLAHDHRWPEAYTDDLYLHDRNQLAKWSGLDVIWILRDHGTHLIVLDPNAEHPRAENRIATPVIRYWSGEHFLNDCSDDPGRVPKFFYIFADGSAVASDAEEAKRVIDEIYPLNRTG